MSHSFLMPLKSIGVLFIISLIAVACNQADNNIEKKPVEDQKELPRDSITFILGDDNAPGQVFYRNAERYFKNNDKEKTGKVVTGCYSISEMLEYLNNHRDTSQTPWGHINLVSHGNPFKGLSVDIRPDGNRCSKVNLEKALKNENLPSLQEHITDKKTTIAIHSCGIGHKKKLLDLLEQTFSGPDSSPRIKASPYFEYFFVNDSTQAVEKFFANYWMISYKMGYKPSDRTLKNVFASLYPDAGIDWGKALENKHAQAAGKVFNYTFEVAGKWVFEYESGDSIPYLQTNSEKLKWVKQKPDIINDLKKLKTPPKHFNWWMRKIYVENDNGNKTPAFWVKGYSTVLCVLKLLPPGKIKNENSNSIISPDYSVFSKVNYY